MEIYIIMIMCYEFNNDLTVNLGGKNKWLLLLHHHVEMN